MIQLTSRAWPTLTVLLTMLVVPVVLGEEKAEKKSSSGHAPQTNAFSRFWIHTVGAPMARGMKDGMKTVYKGMRSGTHKVKEGFMTIGGYKKDEKKTAGKDGKGESGKLDYPLRRDIKGPALARYPGARSVFEQYTGRSLEKAKVSHAKTTTKKEK